MSGSVRKTAWGAARKEFIAIQKDLGIYFDQGCTVQEVYAMLVSQRTITMSYLSFARYVRRFGLRKTTSSVRQPVKRTQPSSYASERVKQAEPSPAKNAKPAAKPESDRSMPNRWDDSASTLVNLTTNKPTADDVLG